VHANTIPRASENDQFAESSIDETTALGFVQFTLATNRCYKNREGDLVELTDWHRVKKYGKGVTSWLPQKLDKGNMVLVEGSFRYESFTDKDGNERNIATVIADRVQLIKRSMAQANVDEDEASSTQS